jgi:hypothetical protein
MGDWNTRRAAIRRIVRGAAKDSLMDVNRAQPVRNRFLLAVFWSTIRRAAVWNISQPVELPALSSYDAGGAVTLLVGNNPENHREIS